MAESNAPSGQDGNVEVTFQGDVAVLTMNCGQNRMNCLFFERMNTALDKVLSNPAARALVTTSGSKYYSNGLDLDHLVSTGQLTPDSQFLQDFESFFIRLLTFPLPTIALVNGHAFAGGAILVTLHDHAIMQTGKGWWCTNEVHLGMRFSTLLLELLRARLPVATFNDSIGLGVRYTGEEAVRAGVVHECCPPDLLLQTAQRWIRKEVPPSGFARTSLQTMKEDMFAHIVKLKGTRLFANM